MARPALETNATARAAVAPTRGNDSAETSSARLYRDKARATKLSRPAEAPAIPAASERRWAAVRIRANATTSVAAAVRWAARAARSG